jgi:hypothetical protein
MPVMMAARREGHEEILAVWSGYGSRLLR